MFFYYLLMIFILHVLLLFLGLMTYIRVFLPAYDYYNKNYPIATKFLLGHFVLTVFFGVFLVETNPVDLLGDVFDFSFFKPFIIPTLIFLIVIALMSIGVTVFDCKRCKEKTSLSLYSKISLIIMFYVLSVTLASEATYYTNYTLDFSQGKDYTVSVIKGYSKDNYGVLTINPTINGTQEVYVNKDLLPKVKQDTQIKITVFNGLYGINYTKRKNIEIVK